MFRHFLGFGIGLGLTFGCGEEEPSGTPPQGGNGGDDTAAETELEGDDAGECTDGADNDLDGLFDCDDPDCGPAPDCLEPSGDNLEPTQPVVEITPAEASSADDLTCAITVESTDPEGDPVSYLYTWEIDGLDSGITSETVMSRFTEGEETWACVVMATDGETVSPPAYDEIALPRDNTPPNAPEVAIVPDEPVPLDDLVCTIVTESTDDEDDPITYSWAWDVDGIDAGNSTDTVSGDDTDSGEVWTCSVTPNDGYEDGNTASASVEMPTCYGSALEFNGSDDLVTIPASGDFVWGSAITVEAWVRWDGETGTDDQVILEQGPEGEYSFTMAVAGQSTSEHPLCGDVSGGSILFMAAGYSGEAKTCLESATPLVAGDWTHLAVTYDGADMYIFMDGVESVYGRTGTELSDASAYDMSMGGRVDDTASFYGIIDELRVSSSARYTADFTIEQAPDVDGDTVLLYHMDEGYGSELSDETGNGHEASVDSATWSAFSSCDAIGAR